MGEFVTSPWYRRVWRCTLALIVVGVLAGAVGCSQATQQTASPATVTGSSADPRPATTQPAATSKRRPGVLWQRTSSDLGPDRTFWIVTAVAP